MEIYGKFINRIRQWDPVTSVSVVIGGYFASQMFGAIVFLIVAAFIGWDPQTAGSELKNSPWLAMGVSLLIYGFFVAIIRAYLHWSKHTLKDIGLKITQKWTRTFLYILAAYGVYFVALLIIMAFIHNYVPAIDLDQKQDLGIDTYSTGLKLVPIFISLVIVPPIAEEIITRGFLFTGLRRKLPLVTSTIITSVLFAAAHLEWGNNAPLLWAAAIDTFMLSLVLIYLRVKTDSLYPSIGLHMLKNLLAFLSLFIFHVAS